MISDTGGKLALDAMLAQYIFKVKYECFKFRMFIKRPLILFAYRRVHVLPFIVLTTYIIKFVYAMSYEIFLS